MVEFLELAIAAGVDIVGIMPCSLVTSTAPASMMVGLLQPGQTPWKVRFTIMPPRKIAVRRSIDEDACECGAWDPYNTRGAVHVGRN